MNTHLLKTWAEPFEEIAAETKTFEFRKNDRDFRVGDMLVLFLYDPETDTSFKSVCHARKVISITKGPDFGIPDGYCCMSLETSVPRRQKPDA